MQNIQYGLINFLRSILYEKKNKKKGMKICQKLDDALLFEQGQNMQKQKEQKIDMLRKTFFLFS